MRLSVGPPAGLVGLGVLGVWSGAAEGLLARWRPVCFLRLLAALCSYSGVKACKWLQVHCSLQLARQG